MVVYRGYSGSINASKTEVQLAHSAQLASDPMQFKHMHG